MAVKMERENRWDWNPLSLIIKKGRLWRFEHVERKDDVNCVKCSMMTETEESSDCVEEDMNSLALSQEDAQFRNQWRRIKGATGKSRLTWKKWLLKWCILGFDLWSVTRTFHQNLSELTCWHTNKWNNEQTNVGGCKSSEMKVSSKSEV